MIAFLRAEDFFWIEGFGRRNFHLNDQVFAGASCFPELRHIHQPIFCGCFGCAAWSNGAFKSSPKISNKRLGTLSKERLHYVFVKTGGMWRPTTVVSLGCVFSVLSSKTLQKDRSRGIIE